MHALLKYILGVYQYTDEGEVLLMIGLKLSHISMAQRSVHLYSYYIYSKCRCTSALNIWPQSVPCYCHLVFLSCR